MPCAKFWLGFAIVASILVLSPLIDSFGALSVKPAYADEAADALKKCDDLASHPLDGHRYSPPVSDDRFATGAAVEACEAAVKLNPDSGRAQFELGRSYWLAGGDRDKDAFAAFAKAAKNNYPIAFKFIGDAFLEGRGLPSGESQSPQNALAWYKKAYDAGLKDVAQKAIDELQAQIDKQKDDAQRAALFKKKEDTLSALEAQKRHDEEENAKFDPNIFAKPEFMKSIYDFDKNRSISIPPQIVPQFARYLYGITKEFSGEHILFLPNGQFCKTLVNSTSVSYFFDQFMNDMGSDDEFYAIRMDRGDGAIDAIKLFNRYGCESIVTSKIIANINILAQQRLIQIPRYRRKSILEHSWKRNDYDEQQ